MQPTPIFPWSAVLVRSIEAGGRDLVFFGAGWTAPHQDGVMVRVTRAERAVVRIPLPARRDYDIVLRLDPLVPERQNRVTLLLNRHLLGSVRLSWNPDRMGSYRLRLPVDMVSVGVNELALIPETLVPASSADGASFRLKLPGAGFPGPATMASGHG